VSGLTGGTLVLAINVNGISPLPITANGAFTFGNIASGTNYTISISSQPDAQTCSLAGASGTSGPSSANATTVSCAAIQPTNFPLGFGNPAGIAYDGNNLWVLSGGSDTLYQVDPGTGNAGPGLPPLNLGGGTQLVYDGFSFWIPSTTGVFKVDKSGNVVAETQVPNPVWLTLEPSNGDIWASASNGGGGGDI
jgi:hypothetical protein